MTADHPFVYPALAESRHVEADFPRLALIKQSLASACGVSSRTFFHDFYLMVI